MFMQPHGHHLLGNHSAKKEAKLMQAIWNIFCMYTVYIYMNLLDNM